MLRLLKTKKLVLSSQVQGIANTTTSRRTGLLQNPDPKSRASDKRGQFTRWRGGGSIQ